MEMLNSLNALAGKISPQNHDDAPAETSPKSRMNSGSNRMDQPDVDAIKMFVGQVPRSMDENDLRKMFEEFGPVHQINVLRDKLSGHSRGCCFVTFYKRKDALEAQNALHNIKTMPGMHHPIQMKPADTENRNERKLFVGMLSKKISESDVRTLFGQFGAIEECTVLRDATGTSRGCAFVTYTSRQYAVNAIKNMHHSQTMEGCSSPMVVKFADTQKDKDQKRIQQATPNIWGITGLGINGLIPQYLTQGLQSGTNAAIQPLAGITPLGMQQLLAASSQGNLASAQALQNLAALQTSAAGLSLANASASSPPDLGTTAMPNLAALANFSTNSSFPCVTDINAMNMQNLAALAAMTGTSANGGLSAISASAIAHGDVSMAPVTLPGYLFPFAGSAANGNQQSQLGLAALASSNGTQLTTVNTRSIPVTVAGINGLGSSAGAGLEALASAYTAGMQQFTSVFPAFGNNALAGRTQSGTLSPLGSQSNQRQQEGPEGANLFIYHLPQEFGDNDIEQIFVPFGNILSAKVFVDKQTNLSKCFGFVSYDNPMSAQSAIQAMNGFQIGTKRLKVQLKRSKDASKPY